MASHSLRQITRHLALLSINFFIGLSVSVYAQGDDVEVVQVTGKQQNASYMESQQEIAERLKQIPGGTNLVDMSEATKLSTLSDALNFQPGVIVQEFFGGLDQPRINIRGSGIQGNPVSRGILLRQDYLPLNEADGSFIIGLVNLRNSQTITVHRGANSRATGSFTLGGDMNFISKMEGNQIQIESGSYGQQSIQGSYGARYNSGTDQASWHTSFVEEKADGYRHHSASQRRQASASFYNQLGQRLKNYSHVHYTDMGFEMPFVLPKETAEQNPRWVFGDGVPIGFEIPDSDLGYLDLTNLANTVMNMYKRDPHRATKQLRFSNRTTYWSDHSDHTLGMYWQETDDAFVDPFSHIETKTQTWGAQWTIDAYPTEYFHFQLGLDANQSTMPRSYTGNHPLQGSKVGSAYAEFDFSAENQALSLLFDLSLTTEWTLTGQWQWGNAERNETQQNLNWQFNLPKLGLIYQPDLGNNRWFFNVSESIEIPTFWELVAVELNPIITWMSEASLKPIQPQEAISVELGGEYFLTDSWSWQATLYHSKIKKELISTASQFGVLAETSNYQSKTIHQGIEFGFNGGLDLPSSQLLLRGSWTYSDFYFDDGVYEGNQIAGVPKNVIMLEALWQQYDWRLGPNIRWVPDDNPVDHENTLGQGAYGLLGFKLEWFADEALRFYMVADNLTDEIYNSSYVVRARSNPQLPTYLPGNGRCVSMGLNVYL